MPSEMRALGEFVDIKHGFAFSGKHIVSNENNRILLTPGHFEIGGGFRHNHKKYYDSNGYKSEYELEPGELIVSMTDLSKEGDTLGYSAIIPKIDGKILLHNQRIGRVIFKDEKLDKGFCHYLMRDRVYRQHILATCTGSTVKHTSPTKILDFRFILPEKSDQKAIAHILGALDDKIELNQKMNQTLEDIAKAVFKSWFVDFDPVRVKAEGRPTGLPDEISDLFPDALEESEIGEIPAGWNERRFSDCEIEIESGRRPKGGIDKSLSEGIPSIGAESIAPAGVFDFSKVKYVTEEFAAKMKRGKVQDFDVALYKDGGKPGQFIPRVGVYGDEFPFSECYVNEHVFLLRSRHLGQPFLYRMVSSDDFLNQLIAKGSAKAAQPGLNQEEVASNRIIVPTAPLLRVFNDMTEPMLKRQFLLGQEIKVLSELRDTLLPKLISGELRIPDAEKFLAEAGI